MDSPKTQLSLTSQGDEETEKEEVATFSSQCDHFFALCDEVLKHDSCGDLLSASSKPNKIQASFNNYRTVFLKTKTSDKHVEKFRAIYTKCRQQIKMDPELDNFMEWFRTTSFIIAPTEKAVTKLHLTAIYRNCVRIADRLNDLAKENPQEAEKYEEDPAATYPEKFILHLFRLFTFCCPEKDVKVLEERINLLEQNLGLAKDENPAVQSDLDQLLSTVSGFASEAGIQIPVGVGKMDTKQIVQGLNGLRQNKQAVEMVKGFFGGVNMNDPSSLTNALGKVAEQMKTNAQQVPEPVQRSLRATAEDAPLPSQLVSPSPSVRK